MASDQETVLVVEDEDIARKNLEHILNKMGYQVTAVNDGTKALDWLESTHFDLVITDLKMKNIDGMEVLRKTKKLHPYTEVILITGYATVDSSVQAMREGAYYYIAKPYKIDEVRKIAQEALLKRRLQLENIELKKVLKEKQDVPFLVGKSEAMAEIVKTLRKINDADFRPIGKGNGPFDHVFKLSNIAGPTVLAE